MTLGCDQVLADLLTGYVDCQRTGVFDLSTLDQPAGGQGGLVPVMAIALAGTCGQFTSGDPVPR